MPTDGPIQFEGADLDQMAYVLADEGDDVVFGALVIHNDGDKPASLVGARLTGPDEKVFDDGATISELKVRDVSDGRDLVGAAQWPYEDYADDAADLKGYKLQPDATAELLFIVKVDEGGHWFWPKTELTYSIGDDKWRAETSTGFLICPMKPERQCNPPTSDSK